MDPQTDMRFLAPSLCSIFGLRRPGESEVDAWEEFTHAIIPTKSVLVVIFDGFGMAALERTGEHCPNLNLLIERNFRTVKSVSPPKTPVNFATMATGASQRGHGVDKKTDPLEIETIFHVLDEGDLRTCVGGRKSGSPANLFSGMVDYADIASTNTDAEVLELVLERLENLVPALTMVQFLDIDNAGHRSGPFGAEASEAIRGTDRKLGSLIRAYSGSGGSVIVLADHGQHEVPGEGDTMRGKHDSSSIKDFIVPLTWCASGDLASVASRVKDVWVVG